MDENKKYINPIHQLPLEPYEQLKFATPDKVPFITPNIYAITNFGRVFSISHASINNEYGYKIIIPHYKDGTQRLFYRLSVLINGKKSIKTFFMSRLILYMYRPLLTLDNYSKWHAHHIDGNPNHNWVDKPIFDSLGNLKGFTDNLIWIYEDEHILLHQQENTIYDANIIAELYNLSKQGYSDTEIENITGKPLWLIQDVRQCYKDIYNAKLIEKGITPVPILKYPKLKNEKIIEIYNKCFEYSDKDLAKMYNIDYTTVNDIRNCKRHILKGLPKAEKGGKIQ